MGLFKVLAFTKIRKACGLDRCELLYTGAAPLSAATADYLKSVDMPLLEVFGMSESCGAIAVSGPLDGARPAAQLTHVAGSPEYCAPEVLSRLAAGRAS